MNDNPSTTTSLTSKLQSLNSKKSADFLLDQLLKPKNPQDTDRFYSSWAANYEKVSGNFFFVCLENYNIVRVSAVK